jgi:hypothetical protein
MIDDENEIIKLTVIALRFECSFTFLFEFLALILQLFYSPFFQLFQFERISKWPHSNLFRGILKMKFRKNK